jgi:RNA polymerase sigma factor for flagellar operon FliA
VVNVEDVLAQTWERWLADRELRDRDALICHYMELARFLASHVGRCVEASLRPDLVSFAAIGLMDAIERFRPEVGVRFETYGSRRIRGAMADGIRTMKWLPRGAERRASRVIETIVPVDFQTATTPSGARLRDSLWDPLEPCASDDLEIAADHAEVVEAMSQLPERERFIVDQIYFAHRPLAAIGVELGITESRVCQLHRRALRMLESILVARLSA